MRDLLQSSFSKDLERCIGPKKAPSASRTLRLTAVFLDMSGGVLDDAIVYQCGGSEYMIVGQRLHGRGPSPLICANRTVSAARLRSSIAPTGSVRWISRAPKAAAILGRILQNPQQVFDKMVYFSFKGSFAPTELPGGAVTLEDGTPLMVSRTGYTGEFGF